MGRTEVSIRRATPADTRPAFDVSMAAMRDLFERQGNEWKLDPEARAHARGLDSISFQVPTINEVAMNHLLGRGFKIDGPLNLLMSNVPFGKFDRLVAFAPAIVL